MTDRGQLSLPAVEAGVGVVFVLAIATGLSFGVAPPGGAAVQLETYAHDAATVLSGEPPRHRSATRLSEVLASPSSFERERDALRHRVERILPDNLLFRVATPHGAVGFRRPRGAPVGAATVSTGAGDLTIWVWYG